MANYLAGGAAGAGMRALRHAVICQRLSFHTQMSV
jgi:hypothetical protein